MSDVKQGAITHPIHYSNTAPKNFLTFMTEKSENFLTKLHLNVILNYTH